MFSLSPTKVLVAGEGGLITTNDDLLAERCRMGRDYGHPGDYDCRFIGLNGRMSEFHAAVGLGSFEDLEERLVERETLAGSYRTTLEDLPGITFPVVTEGDRSTFKDMTILIDAGAFGLGTDDLGRALAAEGIETKRYCSPPVHTMQAYRTLGTRWNPLEVTNDVAARALTLPLWSGMGTERVQRVGLAVRRSRALAGRNGNARNGSVIETSFDAVTRLENLIRGSRAGARILDRLAPTNTEGPVPLRSKSMETAPLPRIS